jgi:hypothetical protein
VTRWSMTYLLYKQKHLGALILKAIEQTWNGIFYSALGNPAQQKQRRTVRRPASERSML